MTNVSSNTNSLCVICKTFIKTTTNVRTFNSKTPSLQGQLKLFNCVSYWYPSFKTCPRIEDSRLTPNDLYIGRTAPLTSKRCILYIYSTNVGTEYFKHALYSPFF